VLTIDDFPDDVLVEIFDFYVVSCQNLDFRQLVKYRIKKEIESWQTLVHVCRRWRCLVFDSPSRLNLELCYHTHKGCARGNLDVWPTLPLLIHGRIDNEDGIISRLKHRISQINLKAYHKFQNPWEAMQVPFPKLEGLYLSIRGHSRFSLELPVLPDSFLGGSAPRLRHLYLNAVQFPGLPKLLLSTTRLVNLYLRDIPQSGCISPQAMATSLSMLTSLKTLKFEFQFRPYYSHPELKPRRPFPPIRSVLPTLTYFRFNGANKYLEEFVARIDAPQLCRLYTTFFDAEFKAPELSQFIISRMPTFGACDEAHFIFNGCRALVRFCQSHPEPSDGRMVKVEILCDELRPSSMAETFTSLRFLSTMENLYIDGPAEGDYSADFWEDIQWLDFLRPFTAVKNLYLPELFSPPIALALEEFTGGRTTEVLPALQNVFLEGFSPSEPVEEGIGQFISARQLTNHPVALFVWNKDPAWGKLSESLDSGVDDSDVDVDGLEVDDSD